MKVLQLKITLKDAKPPVWRRVLVEDNITFSKLHRVIQYAMGWMELHDYEFRLGRMIVRENGMPAMEATGKNKALKVMSAKKLKLSDVNLASLKKFRYIYGFRGNWSHDVTVEKVLDQESGVQYPVCIKGKRNCPPECVGGPEGYEEFIRAVLDPKHPLHEPMLESVGCSYSPEDFNIDEANHMLRSIK